MQIDKRRAALQYQNKVNNAQGHFFEGAIKAACALYSERERADVDKTPEPFRVGPLPLRIQGARGFYGPLEKMPLRVVHLVLILQGRTPLVDLHYSSPLSSAFR